MDYVKGCDINVLSKFYLKRIADGRIEIAENLRDVLSYEVLSDMLVEAKTSFVDSNGKTIKDMPSAEIFFMTKKIDKKKILIGLSVIKRIAGETSDKTGLAKVFENSRDKVVEDKRIFAEGFEKEQAYFDSSMVEHFKSSVGSGSLMEAEFHDKVITRIKGKKVLGVFLSSTALFICMAIIWGLIFKNIGIGICFALCFVGSFTVITSKSSSSNAAEKDLNKTENT